jgi:putative inorganic carbon (HCO3(-)) transporter
VRDAILFLAFACVIPFIFKRPVVGVLAYACVGLMNPHRLTYGAAYNFPFAMLLCGMTLLSLVISKEKKKLPMTGPVLVLLIFIAWMTLTSTMALVPETTWDGWSKVMKTMLMLIVTMMIVRTAADVKALALVVAMSLGFWGFKSGLYTIMSGGSAGMMGPANSYISDNNTLALGLVTSVPLLVYVASQAPPKWIRRGVVALAVLTAVGALGSYSRGALLGAIAMGLFLWLKSSSKLKTGLLIVLLAPIIYLSMPDAWTGRMHSIDDYQEDQSAMGRINSWYFAINVANHYPLGGGMGVFTPRIYEMYAPFPQSFHVAHSIYFEVLADNGYGGLLIFLLLFLLGWRTGTRVLRACKGKPELAWAETLTRMCQVSIIGYLVAGAFLSLAYYDLPYYVLAILVCLEKVLILAPQADNIPPMRLPFLRRWFKPDASGAGNGAPAPGR